MPNTVVQGGAASNAQVVPNMVVFGGAGGRSNEGRLQVDGLSVGTAFNGAGVSAYVADVNNAQEVVLTASGGMGEAETGGPVLNLVPKEGGNRISGQLYGSQVTEGMVGSNYTDDLKARGLTTPGGFTRRVRLQRWHRWSDQEGSRLVVPAGAKRRLRAADPRHVRQRECLRRGSTSPDRTRPAYGAAKFQTTALRVTSQLSAKHRVTALWDEQTPCEGAGLTEDSDACRHSKQGQIICAGASPTPACSPTSAPETGGIARCGSAHSAGALDVTADQPAAVRGGLRDLHEPLGRRTDARRGSELDPHDRPVHHGCRGARTTLRARDRQSDLPRDELEHRVGTAANYRASASYLVGRHTMKVGWQGVAPR